MALTDNALSALRQALAEALHAQSIAHAELLRALSLRYDGEAREALREGARVISHEVTS